MARITVEDCLNKVNNRFSLIHMASKRVRQLRQGAEPGIVTRNRDVVTALREIAAGYVVIAETAEPTALIADQAESLTGKPQSAREEEGMDDRGREETAPERSS